MTDPDSAARAQKVFVSGLNLRKELLNENRPLEDQWLTWVLKDERPGTGNQVVSVGDALGFNYEIKELELATLGRLPNFLLGTSLLAITPRSKELILPPWPDLVISAGRRASSVARYIKRQSGGRSFICQIMYPGSGPAADLDLIIVPSHDQIAGDNISSIVGAPNLITEKRLMEARSKWQEQFSRLPKPIIGLIVGGANKNMPFGTNQTQELASHIARYHGISGGSLIVTTSRRTGEATETLFEDLAGTNCEPSFSYRWGESGPNPYIGMLAHADTLIVTGDSVSMLSEACAAPGNVYVYVPTAFSGAKHRRFHEELFALGAARNLREHSRDWKSLQFNPAEEIAKQIIMRIDC